MSIASQSVKHHHACLRGDPGGTFQIVLVPSMLEVTGYRSVNIARNPSNSTIWTDIGLFFLVPDPGGPIVGTRLADGTVMKDDCPDCDGAGEIYTIRGYIPCIKCTKAVK